MPSQKAARTGISNRESAAEGARERRRHPPATGKSPEPKDAANRRGEQPPNGTRGRQTSRKADSRSSAQKLAEAPNGNQTMPAAEKAPGAFGKEPDSSGHRHAPPPPDLRAVQPRAAAMEHSPAMHLPPRGRARAGETRAKAKRRNI